MKIIFLVLISNFVFAAPKPTKPLTVERPLTPQGMKLAEVLKKGLEYSPDLKKADASVRENEAALGKARAAIFPTIDANGTAYTRQNSTTSAANGANGETYAANISLTQPIYVGGAFTSGVNLYKSKAESARQSYFSKKQDVALDVLSSFYGLSQAQQRLNVGFQNRDILKSYVDITKHYEKIGRSRKMDKLQAAVNYSLSLADVESTSNDLKKSQAALKKLLGIENDSELQVAHVVVINPVEKISLEQAYKAAVNNNPEIRVKKIALEQVEYNRDVDLAADFPNLKLTGAYGYQSPDRASLFTSNSQAYNIGLTLTVPLFSGLSSISKRNIYSEQTYQAQHDLQSTENGIREQIENYINTLQSTRVQLELAQGSVKEAQGALELANSGYKQGIASSLDVVNLQQTRYNAEKLLLTTQYSYLTSLANLRKLMGIDLEKAYGK